MVKIGLCAIAKNEESVVRRMIDSVRSTIDTWVIIDTGSTDKTREVVKEALEGVPGVLLERPWVDFGHNRTEALDACVGVMDWAIMVDCDDSLVADGKRIPVEELEASGADGYYIELHHGTMRHQRVQVFKISSGWRYCGVLHEYPDLKPINGVARHAKLETLKGFTMISRTNEGGRSMDPKKYEKDAAILQADVDTNPDNARSCFYLAQSYQNAGGHDDEAIKYYKKRIGMVGFYKEVYVCMQRLVNLVKSIDEKFSYAVAAFGNTPTRVEAITELLSTLRTLNVPFSYRVFCLASAFNDYNTHPLVAQPSTLFEYTESYNWRFYDEFAICAFWVKEYEASKLACERALLKAPESQKARIFKNLTFASEYMCSRF